MVPASSPGTRPGRQGAELPEAGPRLELPRAERGTRRDPARARADVSPRTRLPLSLLPRPHDLPRGGIDRRGNPPERDVEGDRSRLRRTPHVEPLREARDRHSERFLRGLESRAARRGPRARRQGLRAGFARVLLRRRVVHLGRLLLRGRQRGEPRAARRHLRRPGQRIRHLRAEGGADGQRVRVRQFPRFQERRRRPLRRHGRLRFASARWERRSNGPGAAAGAPSSTPGACESDRIRTPTGRSSTGPPRSWPRRRRPIRFRNFGGAFWSRAC